MSKVPLKVKNAIEKAEELIKKSHNYSPDKDQGPMSQLLISEVPLLVDPGEPMEDKSIYKRCLDTWGIDAQMNQTAEECAELIVAINHYRRGRIDINDLMEEVADVYLMINQLMLMDENGSSFEDWVEYKIKRVKERLDEAEVSPK